jgi:predicted CXXCH cytochrome family protein
MNLIRAAPLLAGRRHKAAEDLHDTRIVLRGTDRNLATESEWQDWQAQQRHVAAEAPDYMINRFWTDGMVRVSGREHNAMIESACYLRGDLTCLSCHTMHRGDPDDQLKPELAGNALCLQCHTSYAERIEEHTHHRPESSGSACMNCHMPHTVYGLLKAIRSHWIDSPTVAAQLQSGRPNACNLCHLDRTLAWTAEHLHDMYGQPPVALGLEDQTISAAVLMLLTGDANQRALLAWHMGWPAAREASGEGWMTPYLAHLLNDPYAAVRYIAWRSLSRAEAYRGLAYDFIGSAEARAASQQAVLSDFSSWMKSQPRPLPWASMAILVSADGQLDTKTLQRLSAQRNERDVDLRE